MKVFEESILVTGASGFIGTNLIKSENFKYLTTLKTWNKYSMGTLLEKFNRERQLDLLSPTTVVHLAWAPTNKEGYEKFPDNLLWGESTISFARECMERNIRFITIGSAVEERQNDLVGSTPYAKAKNMIREELSLNPLINNISYLKPSYIFSIENQRPRLLKDFINNMGNTHGIVKNPSHFEEFIHIDDVISGLTMIMENDLRGILKLGGGVKASVSDFINVVSINLGLSQKFPWSVPRFKSVEPNYPFNTLGWRAGKTTEFFAPK